MPSLRSLAAHERITIPLVVTQPDRPAGRGRRLTPPPVRTAAEELGLAVYQPEALRDQADLAPLREAAPDLLVVVAYGEILRRPALELAPHGALNVHPSLLPRYRGAAPVRAAILHGDEVTGVSIIKLIRKLDAGPIVAQREVEILPGENAAELEARLAEVAAEMLPGVCLAWAAGELEAREQDDAAATLTVEWSRDDALIDWYADAPYIERLVRAAQPWPVAWTRLDGQPFRIHAAEVGPEVDMPVGIARRVGRQILVSCGQGTLALERVQPAGKQAMPALSWWNGVQADEVQFDLDL